MRNSLSLPTLALAALLGFSTGGAQAGRFFGPVNDGAIYTYPYSYRSQNSFDFGSGPNYQTRHPHFRHRLFHRDQGVVNKGMPTDAMPGYGMSPVNGVPWQTMPTPMVQSPIPTAPVPMTSVAPALVPVAPAVPSQSCKKCGQSGQAPTSVFVAPSVQSRLVPIPAPMPSGPTTAEPPPADATGKAPF